MLQKIILAGFSLLFLLGASSCDRNYDAFRCVLITVDDKGAERPLDQWYWYCLNNSTNEEKTIWLKDSKKCIRDANQECKWMGTDVLEYERFKKEYEAECRNKKWPTN